MTRAFSAGFGVVTYGRLLFGVVLVAGTVTRREDTRFVDERAGTDGTLRWHDGDTERGD